MCKHVDSAPSNLVYSNQISTVGRSIYGGPDVIKDPTLARANNVSCSNCQHSEAVFFHADQHIQKGMKLVFVCTGCTHRWIQ